jgi:xanthine dehydrogenase/oxidase
MVEFRRSLAASFLYRFFVRVATRLEADDPTYAVPFPESHRSAAAPYSRPPTRGLQYFTKARHVCLQHKKVGGGGRQQEVAF